MNRALPLLLAAAVLTSCSGGDGTPTDPGNKQQGASIALLEISPGSGSVSIGQSLQLTAIPYDANGNLLENRTISWSTNAPSVASVSNGLVAGVGPGTATITATSEGKSATASVLV
jgi:hypothetical protein